MTSDKTKKKGSSIGGAAPVPDRRESPYEMIRNAVLDGRLPPGAPLVESALAEWCEVSRTPIREALTRLQQDGLVHRGDRGLVVRQRSPEEILDIYSVRIVLEATAAREAAKRHTAFDAARIEKRLRMPTADQMTDERELVRLNREFHHAVLLATHNGALIDLIERLNLHLARYPATTLSYPGRLEEAHKEHRALVEAILERDGDAAAEVAEQHFTRARHIRLALWLDEQE